MSQQRKERVFRFIDYGNCEVLDSKDVTQIPASCAKALEEPGLVKKVRLALLKHQSADMVTMYNAAGVQLESLLQGKQLKLRILLNDRRARVFQADVSTAGEGKNNKNINIKMIEDGMLYYDRESSERKREFKD